MRRAVLAVVSCFVLSACAGPRPLHVVESDGDYHFDTAQYPKAVTDYSEYVNRKPDNVEVRYKLARSLIAADQPRPAIEQLTVCTDVDPLNDRYLDAQAQALHAAGEREALVAILSRAASERGRVTDYLRLGVYQQKLGNLDEAQQALLTAAKLDLGRSWKVQRALADFYGSVGDAPRQIRRLRMAYYLEPNNPETLQEIRRLGEVPGPTFGLLPEEVRLVNVPDSN